MQVGVMEPVLSQGDDEQLFREARRLGFGGVEVVVTAEQLAAEDRLERLRAARAATGLDVPSIVLGEHSDDGGIADGDAAVAGRARREVERAIAWAAELDCGAILLPFFGRAALDGEADLDRAAAAFRPLCERAAPLGVTLCYEGTLPAEQINLLAERLPSSAFGCYFDLANVVPLGLDAPTELRALGPLVRRVHLKDARVAVGDCPPGLGRVDFGACAEALDEIRYDGWVVLETPPAPAELVARDLSFARSVLPGLPRQVDWPRLGIFTYEFGRGQWRRLIETCRELGLQAVQLGDPMLSECLEDPGRIESVIEPLREEGIAIAALAGYRNLVAPDPRRRRRNIDFIVRCLEFARRFGTSVVATETGTLNPENDWRPHRDNRTPVAWALLDEAIGELTAAAERCGSILALEATVNNVLGTYAGLDGLLERFPSRHLQVVLDPYNYVSRHLLAVQDRLTRDFLDRFEHRFVLAHLKDVGERGADVSTVEFGTGVFVQEPYVRFLATRRPDLPQILEHLPLEHVPDAIRRLERLASPVCAVQLR
jgi:sugar phosphate isomerase/epimerase